MTPPAVRGEAAPTADLRRAAVALAAAYCRHVPLRGKARIQRAASPLLRGLVVRAHARGGGDFELTFPEDHGWEGLFFQGTFELETSGILREVLRPGQVFLDVGANIGWYSILAARAGARCHAFEPVPALFRKLQRNCALNGVLDRVAAHRLALGERDGMATFHTFRGLPHGHSSVHSLGRSDFVVSESPQMRLDGYLEREGVPQVDVVKMDAEGAEMAILRGAVRLWGQARPPAWVLELNPETSRAGGHVPADLLRFLERQGPHRFYSIEPGGLRPIAAGEADAHPGNALAVPLARLDDFLGVLP